MNETPPEPSNNENNVVEEGESVEEKVFKPQNDLPFPNEIDLNEVFPDEDKDLNDLFQDEETKILLKKMQKNKKDLHTMTDRFLDEDWSSAELSGDGPAADEDSAESHEGDWKSINSSFYNSGPIAMAQRDREEAGSRRRRKKGPKKPAAKVPKK